MLPEVAGVRLYPPLIGLAVAVGVAIFVRLARGAGWRVRDAIRLPIILAAAGLVGAYVYSIAERGILASVLSGDASGLVRASLRYPGGVVGVVLALPLVARLRPAGVGWLATADILAPAMGVAMAAVRVGCLMQGCCFGSPTTLPWGIRFPKESPAWFAQLLAGEVSFQATETLPVHPLQLYFALVALGAGFVAWVLLRGGARPGRAAAAFLALHDTGRALLEPLRVPQLAHLQIASAALAAGGVILFFALRAPRLRASAPAATFARPSLVRGRPTG